MPISSPTWIDTHFSCRGRRALITGASRGIGRSLAFGLAQAGADVVIAARDADALKETAAELGTYGQVVEIVTFDQREVDEVRSALSELGPIDILINNAGVEHVCPSLEVSETIWDNIVDTNLKGAFFVAQMAARHMTVRQTQAQTGGGVIINLASLTSFVGVPTAAPYGAAKAGILGMTRALAAEWAPMGIRVNAIAPGYFHTKLTDVFYQDTEWVDRTTAGVPLGRLGNLEDLTGAVIFLASDAASYVTGQCLVIDGGYLASI